MNPVTTPHGAPAPQAAFNPLFLDRGQVPSLLPATGALRWLWACRALDRTRRFRLLPAGEVAPRAGDVVLAEVTKIRNHTRIMTTENERLRLYEGDVLVGVFGSRYATDAFEAEVETVDSLHLLTGAGMMGTVRSHHATVKPPTELRFLGYLGAGPGERINLKQELLPEVHPVGATCPVIFVVGTGMNSGKTTAMARLVKGLLRQGLRVAACKLTGSVSHRDQYEMRATGAHHVRDFSDYGFPSTYLCERDELARLFRAMIGEAARALPDVAVVEIADGVLQRETALLLEDAEVRSQICGVVLTAGCALSALQGVAEVERYGHRVAAVSGLITNAPLFVREFGARRPDVPVGSSAGGGNELAALIAHHVKQHAQAA